jgi:hypothetical protein
MEPLAALPDLVKALAVNLFFDSAVLNSILFSQLKKKSQTWLGRRKGGREKEREVNHGIFKISSQTSNNSYCKYVYIAGMISLSQYVYTLKPKDDSTCR